MTYYSAEFKLFKDGEDTERTITVYGSTKNKLKMAVGRLNDDYPETKGYTLQYVGVKSIES